MQIEITSSELNELFLGIDTLIDEGGITLTNCQLAIKLLTLIIQDLEKTDNHRAIRRAYGDLDNFLKWQNDLQQETTY